MPFHDAAGALLGRLPVRVRGRADSDDRRGAGVRPPFEPRVGRRTPADATVRPRQCDDRIDRLSRGRLERNDAPGRRVVDHRRHDVRRRSPRSPRRPVPGCRRRRQATSSSPAACSAAATRPPRCRSSIPRPGHVTKLPSLPRAVGHAMAFAVRGRSCTWRAASDDIGNTLARDRDRPVSGTGPDTAVEPNAGPRSPTPPSSTTADGAAVLLGGTSFGTTVADGAPESGVSTWPSPRPRSQRRAEPMPRGRAIDAVARHLPAAAEARPFAGHAPRRRPRQRPAARPEPGGEDRLAVPVAVAAAPPARFYFPDDAFWVHGGHAILVNEEENNLLAEIAYPSGKTIWTYGHAGGPAAPRRATCTSPTTSTLTPEAVSSSPTRRTAGSCSSRRRGNPSRQVGQTGNCAPGLPEDRRIPERRHPAAERRPTDQRDQRRTRQPRHQQRGPSGGRPRCRALHVPSDPQLIDRRLHPGGRLRHPGAVIRFSPDGKVLWYYHPTSGPGCSTIRASAAPLPNGLIAVNDDYNHRVVLIDPRHEQIVWQYGHPGVPAPSPGYLEHPGRHGPAATRRRRSRSTSTSPARTVQPGRP